MYWAVVLLGGLFFSSSADAIQPFVPGSYAMADSVHKPLVPPDSNCCDSTVHIKGEIIVPSRNKFDTLSSGVSGERKIKKPWPTGALFRSLLIPGWGQVYNKKYFKAVLYGGTEIYLIYKVQLRWRQMDMHKDNFLNTTDSLYKAEQFGLFEKRRDSRNVHMWLTGLVVFLSMFDAYVDAHLSDFDQTDKAFRVYFAPDKDKIQIGLVYNFR